jgi:UDP-N-acetyl-2-amino-2-deoxyglucuronate dehydrogenase
MSAAPFGYGIVGCGWVADAHAWGVRALAEEDVALVAVADTDLTRAEQLAARFGGPQAHADYRELLQRDDVHAVSICLPDFLHEEATAAAAAAGKHVLCEKPLAVDLAGADAMVDAARRHGINLGLVMNHRYAPDNIRTRAAVRDGALGRLVVGDVMHSSSLTGDPDNSSPWRGVRGRSAGGVLSTQAIHFVDLLLWFHGRVASVQAFSDTLVRTEQDHEDTVALALRFESGALATVVTTNASPITDDFTGTRLEVQGTDGYIALEGDVVRRWECGAEYEALGVELPAPPAGSDEVIFGAGHVHEVVDFVRAARRKAPAPVPGEDGRHLMAVLAAAYTSAREGREAPVSERLDAYSRQADDRESLLFAVTQTPIGEGDRRG